MIVMLDTSEDLSVCKAELGGDIAVEQLLTPLTRFNLQRPNDMFAIDNGAYANFNWATFTALLAREKANQGRCRWVAAPDVVGSALRTAELWEHLTPTLLEQGWPMLYVCQDGQESLPIPWRHCLGVFIGGTTKWKESPYAEQCIKCAKAQGKWVHMGRVNTPARYEWAENLGVDSIDGTGLSRYSHMREAIYRLYHQEKIF
jgi:hypothetical protein